MSKIQNNPTAMNLMMEAMSDSDLRSALQVAIGGSPADLLKAGRDNPKIANFLKELWSELDMDDVSSVGKSAASNDLLDSAVLDATGDQIATDNYSEMVEIVKEELEKSLKPELLNRIDEIVVFSPLGEGDLRSISKLILDEIIRRAHDECGIVLRVSDKLVDSIIQEGTSANASSRFGARPMRRAVQKFFEDTVSDVIIKGFLTAGDRALVQLVQEENILLPHPHAAVSAVRILRERDNESMLSYINNAQQRGAIMKIVNNSNTIYDNSGPRLMLEADMP